MKKKTGWNITKIINSKIMKTKGSKAKNLNLSITFEKRIREIQQF
jgi:hypothetical protein